MLRRPIGFIEPCQPSAAHKPPSGPGWIHEIKHDGYRMMGWRAGRRVRLFTRNGNDWSELFPAVVAAVKALDVRSCLIDGEVVVCPRPKGPGFSVCKSPLGVSTANALYRRYIRT
jgi:bifunctional non-homologous end joining protein LigD